MKGLAATLNQKKLRKNLETNIMVWWSAFFLLYGLFSLIMGILNKGGLRWLSIQSSLKYQQRHKRSINVIMGLISIALGIAMYRSIGK